MRNSITNKSHNGHNTISVHLGVYVFDENGVYIAYCPALDLSGYGNNMEEAKKSFSDTLCIYIEYAIDNKTLEKDLLSHGWSLSGKRVNTPALDKMMTHNRTLRKVFARREYSKYSETVKIPELA
jgi:hypothetical protein